MNIVVACEQFAVLMMEIVGGNVICRIIQDGEQDHAACSSSCATELEDKLYVRLPVSELYGAILQQFSTLLSVILHTHAAFHSKHLTQQRFASQGHEETEEQEEEWRTELDLTKKEKKCAEHIPMSHLKAKEVSNQYDDDHALTFLTPRRPCGGNLDRATVESGDAHSTAVTVEKRRRLQMDEEGKRPRAERNDEYEADGGTNSRARHRRQSTLTPVGHRQEPSKTRTAHSNAELVGRNLEKREKGAERGATQLSKAEEGEEREVIYLQTTESSAEGKTKKGADSSPKSTSKGAPRQGITNRSAKEKHKRQQSTILNFVYRKSP